MGTVGDLSSPRALIEAVQRGSRGALKRLYELEARRLHGIALRIARRPELAADVLQDAFVQVWQNASSFSPERGDASAWLTGIVRYRALDAVRKFRREVLSDDPRLGDRAEEPDIVEQLDRRTESDALQRCLKALEPSQRRVVLLAFVEGLSHAQIADRVSAPLGTVKSWVRRALWPERSGWRNSLALWRSVALATSAVAAALLVYIVLAPPTPGPNLVAFLHVPSDMTPVWLVSAGRDSLTLQAVSDHPVPSGRDLELWTIPAGGGRPEPLGVIPAAGRLVVSNPPAAVTAGATLAISVEPIGGSPTGQPTGPVVFVGTIIRAS